MSARRGQRATAGCSAASPIDDVVDVIREEAEHSVMSMAGLPTTKTCSPACCPRRGGAACGWASTWLTAFLAASVVERFEGTIEKVARWRC